MATHKKTLLYCFLAINVTFLILNVVDLQNLWGYSNKAPLFTLTLLNTTTNSPNLRRGISNIESLNINATGDPAAIHPFDQLSLRLDQLKWDPKRIDEVIRKYFNTEKSFLEYKVDFQKRTNQTILSTSCLHTAAWIVTGLLEMQIRPNNLYIGLFRLPKNKNHIVYNNTQKPPSTLAEPVTQSIRSFINSRPSNEPILLQVDMYQIRSQPAPYIDHHFAIHIYNGSINLYQGWQDEFNLIDWMKNPAMLKFRYPMPIETFLAHYEIFLTYTEEQDRERLKAIWEIFGTTETLVYHRTKGSEDATVRALRYPWVVSLITHWPNPQ